MKKKHFSFDSSDRETSLHGILWLPDGNPKMILQISHGMTEYIERYDEFGEFMANKGVLVIGNDHLGHGMSVTEGDKYGYFASADGYEKVIHD